MYIVRTKCVVEATGLRADIDPRYCSVNEYRRFFPVPHPSSPYFPPKAVRHVSGPDWYHLSRRYSHAVTGSSANLTVKTCNELRVIRIIQHPSTTEKRKFSIG